MYNLLTILIVIAGVLLTLLVLVQNSKGGGLAAGFASGNQVMGAPKTADFLERASWTLVGIIAFLSVFAVGVHKNSGAINADESAISAQVQDAADALPAAPAADFGAEEE